MGQSSLPRLQNTVLLLKNEIQGMVEKLKPILQKLPSDSGREDKYQEFVGKLAPNAYKIA
jgi:hypothetical protein